MFRLNLRLLLILAACISGCGKHYSSAYSPSSSGPPSSGANPASTQDSGSRSAQTTPAQAIPPPPFTRPPMEFKRGQYFSYLLPAGWQAHETGSGVDMNSSDGRLVANASMLVGSLGTTTPWNFTYSVLSGAGCSNINGLSTTDLPSLPSGYPGIDWQIQEFDLTFTDQKGVARHGDVTAAICNAYGGYSALFQGYSSPAAEYDQAKTWLPLIASSVNAIDPSKVAYQNQVIPARNHPLDDAALMESWQARRISQDKIAKAQHEATMGYERMVSPSTGRYYNMPFELYDGGYAGYHNPDHPEEILKPTQPGE